jgi:geranylgeranyl diphosphate synthase, type II
VPTLTDAISSFVEALLPKDHPIPEIALLYRMMRDYPARGGKMIRSKLLLASALAHGGSLEKALPLAVALELFQNWILIHDDIEDDSLERRGRPALHREYGLPLALNAGDALHVYMWQVVYQSGIPGAMPEFFEMIHQTAEGQHMDLGWVERGRWDITQVDYLELVRRKTARYTVVSPLKLGALAAGCVPDDRLTQAGLDLGVAFQIRDDVLNLDGDFERYGKEITGDLFEGKRTLMLVHLLEHASEREREEVLQVMNKPRAEKSESEVARVLELLRAYGSIPFAQAVADDHAKRGLETLRASLETLPGREAALEIIQTAEALATRVA